MRVDRQFGFGDAFQCLRFLSTAILLFWEMLAGAALATAVPQRSAQQVVSDLASSATRKSGASDLKPPGDENTSRQAPGPERTHAGLRDPFKAVAPRQAQDPPSLSKIRRPPGIPGLLIGELQLRGIIEEKASHRMVAMVTSGGNLAYFLHESDQLYDGAVTRITPAALYLSRKGTSSGANPQTGSIVLRLQPEPGENP
jgi:hypothetical protein